MRVGMSATLRRGMMRKMIDDEEDEEERASGNLISNALFARDDKRNMRLSGRICGCSVRVRVRVRGSG